MKYKEDLRDLKFKGYVVDVADPKKKGRLRIRIDRFHGRESDATFIPTSDLPWASPAIDNHGLNFSTPSLGKVIICSFLEGDPKKMVYEGAEHYNINLQEKLQSLSQSEYADFYAISFDDKFQFYQHQKEGLVFDYLKTNINIDINGNIALNLRDGKSKIFLGADKGEQAAMLGNHWMDWMRDFIKVIMTKPYLGNLGAPVIPGPDLLEICSKFIAYDKSGKFLSDYVFIVDDLKINKKDRKYDKKQDGDNFNRES
jgi:hypothetical protein